MSDPTADTLARIDTKLSAMLALLVDSHLRATDAAKVRPRSVDRLLTDAGLTGVEVGRLLGKSKQAVSQALARDVKVAKGASGKAASAALSETAE